MVYIKKIKYNKIYGCQICTMPWDPLTPTAKTFKSSSTDTQLTGLDVWYDFKTPFPPATSHNFTY